jgi:hypothetical protein
MTDLFTWIYSGGGGREVHETFKRGAQATEVWEPLVPIVDLGGVMVIVLVTGPKVRGFKPGRRRWVFKVDKNP